MKLHLERQPSGLTCTIGNLYVDDVWECFTLEDLVREVEGQPVEQWKVYSKTAIPRGTYEVRLTFSNRFQKVTPELFDVRGFVGIRMHPGNTDVDTDGCVLPGTEIGPSDESILNSRKAYDALMVKLEKASTEGEKITIEVA